MFEVIKDREVIAIIKNPTYILKHERGFYILCDEASAQGIVLEGKKYSLIDRVPLEGTETVTLSPVDEGKLLLEGINQSNDQNELMVDHEYRLTLLELGVSE